MSNREPTIRADYAGDMRLGRRSVLKGGLAAAALAAATRAGLPMPSNAQDATPAAEGAQVALEADVLHELHVAKVRETLAAHRIARRVDSDIKLQPRQILNGVPILTTGQPPDGYASRVAIVLLCISGEFAMDPRHRLLPLRVSRLGHALGRHPVSFQRGNHSFPILKTVPDGSL